MIIKNNFFLFRRSLVANLAAANHFTVEHLDNPKNKQYIEKAKIFYAAVNNILIIDLLEMKFYLGIFLYCMSRSYYATM